MWGARATGMHAVPSLGFLPPGKGAFGLPPAVISRDGHVVLAGIALTAQPGELIAICGPNGAGKSTLLRALAGLPQDARCAWGLTVAQVAALGRIPHRDSAALPITRAMQQCGIETLRNQRVDRISGGAARRAMLARVFATEPDVLLLDEPTADLDPAVAHAIMRRSRQTLVAWWLSCWTRSNLP